MTRLTQPLNGTTTRAIIGTLITIILLLVGFYGTWTKDELVRLANIQTSFVTVAAYQRDQDRAGQERRRNADGVGMLQKEMNATIIGIFSKLTEIQLQVARLEQKK
uniref:Uncharacterized protein n=1 Tax=viral metagenome TaxID=1070528 RepID=A0A6M3IJL1_9ZZZZ